MRASSRGLGELLLAVAAEAVGPILVGLGDTATVDGGAGLLEVVGDALRRPRATGPVRRAQSAARRAGRGARLRPAEGRVAGAGRGARGAARRDGRASSLRTTWPAQAPPAGSAPRSPRSARELVSGVGARPRPDRFPRARRSAPTSSSRAKGRSTARAARGRRSARSCGSAARQGVRCAVFGGRVDEAPPGVEPHALSGDPDRAADDLVAARRAG